jgi:hypothetical protein
MQKKMKTIPLIIIALLVLSAKSFSTTITAVASGNWTSNSTWSCNCQPTNADNIIIPAGITVTSSGPVILFLGPVITITINGTLVLNNGSLQVDATDIIKINSGGQITGTGLTGGAVYSGVIPIFIANGSSIAGPKTITNGTLPVTLLFFDGEQTEDKIILSWASASELNFDYYDIDRSPDAIQFTELGKVNGSDDSRERRNYSFEDNSPLIGNSYYRIRAVDLNGSVAATIVTSVNFQGGKRNFETFPNPVTGTTLTTRLNFYPQTGGAISMVDCRGDNVYQETLSADKNEYIFQYTHPLVSGVYFILVRTPEETLHSKIIVP